MHRNRLHMFKTSNHLSSSHLGKTPSKGCVHAHIFLQEYAELDLQPLRLDLLVNFLAKCLEALYSYQRLLVKMWYFWSHPFQKVRLELTTSPHSNFQLLVPLAMLPFSFSLQQQIASKVSEQSLLHKIDSLASCPGRTERLIKIIPQRKHYLQIWLGYIFI